MKVQDSSFYVISKKNFIDLLDRFSKTSRVYVPYRKQDTLYFDTFDIEKADSLELGVIRQSQPLKSFIHPVREKVFGSSSAEEDRKAIKTVIVGVKACDIAGMVIQDYVFLQGDIQDPFYKKLRESTAIISSDCTEVKETCFCLAMAGRPYPEKGYDINISLLKSVSNESYLVEVATEKGQRILNEFRSFFTPADSSHLKFRDDVRKKIVSQEEQILRKRDVKDTKAVEGAVKRQFDNMALWEDQASTCVECGACNLICPTCHCFLLFDQKDKDTVERLREWDSCLYKTFARVAGGANPRKHLRERLRNRFEKKFDYFPRILGVFACTGCGRCIEACPGDIDIREVLKGLVANTWKKPPHT